MAAITNTPANIRPGTFAVMQRRTTSAETDNGEAVTLAAAETVAPTADDTANFFGIVATNDEHDSVAPSGHDVGIVVFGIVEGYSGLTPGKAVYLGATAGTLDDASGTVLIGYCLTTTAIFVMPAVSAVASS